MNTLFPGRPNYTGPTIGYFGLLHHDRLFEESHNVMERVSYVKSCKPAAEISIRLRSMIYLGDCEAVAKRAPLDDDYYAKRAPLEADYDAKLAALKADYYAKLAPLDADYYAKRAPLYADYEAKLAALEADYKAKRAPLYADYYAKRAPLYADYEAKLAALEADILAYIRTHIPDCAWNGTKLVFG